MAADAGDPGLGDDAAGFGEEADDDEDMEREAPELLEPPERRRDPSARLTYPFESMLSVMTKTRAAGRGVGKHAFKIGLQVDVPSLPAGCLSEGKQSRGRDRQCRSSICGCETPIGTVPRMGHALSCGTEMCAIRRLQSLLQAFSFIKGRKNLQLRCRELLC